MKRNILFGLAILVVVQVRAIQYPIIIDHDGGIDDVIAATLQMLHSPEAVKAITIVPADCYGHPAAWVTTQLKEHFLPSHIHVPLGISGHEGINEFPALWREHAWKLADLSLWKNEVSLNDFSLEQVPSACSILERALREATVPVKILMTGPCTNIAEVLREYPELKTKIHRVFVMGGALYVKGNVEEVGHDGSAEWNIYNHPNAFQEVLSSGVPMTLVPLDATQYTPIRKEFMAKLEECCHIKQIQLVDESLKTIQPVIDSGEYLFWDTLTSAVLINPAIVTTKKIKINVILEGPSMGKTIEDENGFEVDVALWADQPLFEKTVLDVLLQ